MPYTLPELSYSFDSLEPYIDTETMKIHHGKHHQTYVDKLNLALEDENELTNLTVEDLLKNYDKVPAVKQQAVENHGGGHANHSLFWEILTPGGANEPVGEVSELIKHSFGDFGAFKSKFSDAALGHFGSGWAWLVIDRNGKAEIITKPNQDSPIIEGYKPILGLDVWEHAYYLKYQNKRADYVEAFWAIVNWDRVEEIYKH